MSLTFCHKPPSFHQWYFRQKATSWWNSLIFFKLYIFFLQHFMWTFIVWCIFMLYVCRCIVLLLCIVLPLFCTFVFVFMCVPWSGRTVLGRIPEFKQINQIIYTHTHAHTRVHTPTLHTDTQTHMCAHTDTLYIHKTINLSLKYIDVFIARKYQTKRFKTHLKTIKVSVWCVRVV